MWQQKTQDELFIEKAKKKIDLKTPAIVAFISSCIDFLGFQTMESFCVSFIISFFLSYLGLFLFGDSLFFVGLLHGACGSSKTEMWICNKCQLITVKSSKLVCSCGGKIEPIENWKWVDGKGPK